MVNNVIAIIDYGVGNIASVANMIDYVGGDYEIVGDPKDLGQYDKIILPGVGYFSKAMKLLEQGQWIDTLHKAKDNGKYIMGICLGMQLMTSFSEEGNCDGLGWFSAKTIKFNTQTEQGDKVIIPHMGWNSVQSHQEEFIKSDDRFYFVHSYYVDAVGTTECLTETTYTETTYASGIRKGNIIGLQFHPEKSHTYGMQVFRNFIAL